MKKNSRHYFEVLRMLIKMRALPKKGGMLKVCWRDLKYRTKLFYAGNSYADDELIGDYKYTV